MKTACIYHSIDLDGWMSAAIVKYWFLTNREGIDSKYEIFIKEDSNSIIKTINGQDCFLDFIGYNYGQPIPDLSSYDRVLMCDISFPKEEMEKVVFPTTGVRLLIWIDHHISAIKSMNETEAIKAICGIRSTNFSACELTWQYFFPKEIMPEIVNLLGLYDTFRHKGTDKETEILEFQYGTRQCISNYKEAYEYLIMSIENLPYEPRIEENILICGKGIYSYLCTEAKQIYKNAFEIKFKITDFYEGTQIPMGSHTVKFICINKERFNPVNFGIDYHKDGYDGCACFHYDGSQWCFSLYNDNGEVDCSEIAKQYGGGGHKGAAGFRIKNIEEFLNK